MVKIKKERKNKWLIWVVVLFVLSLILLLYSLLFRSEVILDEKEIEMTLEINDKAGFAVNGSALIFGRLTPSTSSYKDIMLTNGYSFPIAAEFTFLGNISEYMVKNNPERLDVGERRNVTISTIVIPKNATFGNYSGSLRIIFKRAK